MNCQDQRRDATPSEASTPKSDPSSGISLGSVLLTLASGLTAIAALLGYGVTLAGEDRFAIPNDFFYGSALELIQLSRVAAIHALTTGTSVLTLGEFFSFYQRALDSMWLAILGTLIGAALVLTYILSGKRLRAWGQRAHSRSISKLRRTLNPANSQSTKRLERLLLFTAAVTASIMLSPIAVWICIMLSFMVFVAFLMIPMVGLAAGTAHIDQNVILPTACHQLTTASARIQAMSSPRNRAATPQADAKRAHCLKITIGKDEFIGRAVFQTSHFVILYTPSNGAVKRIPLNEALIEVSPVDE
jgi:hypothetical protein